MYDEADWHDVALPIFPLYLLLFRVSISSLAWLASFDLLYMIFYRLSSNWKANEQARKRAWAACE